jgi:DNA-binding YbaB/EbfC family protein
MGNLARMAQPMQADMARIEQELRDLQVEGSAGGGVVKAVVTGKQEIVSLTIDPGVVDPEDVEMLQDLIVAAVGDALTNARRTAEERMARVTGGLRIPGL